MLQNPVFVPDAADAWQHFGVNEELLKRGRKSLFKDEIGPVANTNYLLSPLAGKFKPTSAYSRNSPLHLKYHNLKPEAPWSSNKNLTSSFVYQVDYNCA